MSDTTTERVAGAEFARAAFAKRLAAHPADSVLNISGDIAEEISKSGGTEQWTAGAVRALIPLIRDEIEARTTARAEARLAAPRTEARLAAPWVVLPAGWELRTTIGGPYLHHHSDIETPGIYVIDRDEAPIEIGEEIRLTIEETEAVIRALNEAVVLARVDAVHMTVVTQ